MSNIIDLYKKHINSNPDALEIHNLFSRFELSEPHINYPNCPPFEKLHEKIEVHRLNKVNLCKEWIIKNSRININK